MLQKGLHMADKKCKEKKITTAWQQITTDQTAGRVRNIDTPVQACII